MNKILHRLSSATVLVACLALSGCSSSEHSEQESFAFAGTTLNVIHDNANMPVTVSAHTVAIEESSQVIVEVQTQTLGQSPETPAWSLTDDTLDIGTPCAGSVVGYCEASYSIRVPAGTEVMVNGRPTTVG
ncbi:hypothetical protein ERC79_10525 [Rhodococcus sp. ABRD24]|uniref:hypothetical protein n=1 Tax=Rhodococcus sp. ABRD24 TaxID=2507582 RepID=UPI001039A6FE|nr:hypothetical protein [Rhodococcus sp. ABRD24]QBJ96352.1 hypothetical protein ERC79_10525 [Rhodococcus sp. ABRD24]